MKKEKIKFKEGQVYRCIKSDVKDVFTVGELYPVTKTLEGELVIHSDGGTGHTDKFLNTVTIVEFELEGDKSDSTSKLKPVFINVENLMEHIILNKLEVNEILSYLDGYVEGSRY